MDALKNLTQKQIETKEKIYRLSKVFGVAPSWAASVAMVESSLGVHQKSPTGCRGVFQMSGIAMKDLLYSMEHVDDDLVDIACGILFLRLLMKRWGTMEKATEHYCDPADRGFYMGKVQKYRLMFEGESKATATTDTSEIEARISALERQCHFFHMELEKLSQMRTS